MNYSSALMRAAQKGQKETVQLLLAVPDIDVNMQGIAGCCALTLAAHKGHKETVQLLLAVQEIDVNVQDIAGQCALYWQQKRVTRRLCS